MITIHNADNFGITFTIETQPEEQQLAKDEYELMLDNARDLSEFEHKEAIDSANKWYEEVKGSYEGDWIWCCVKVSACHDGLGLIASDFLGGCSYKNESDFKACGYYEDMQQTALDELLVEIRHAKVCVNCGEVYHRLDVGLNCCTEECFYEYLGEN